MVENTKKMVLPRQVPDRDTKYMGLAWMMAGFSKDPSTQIGAIIVDGKNNQPLGWGYNGPPQEIDDNSFSWERPDKYDFIVHAEENAIDHSILPVNGCTLYVTGLPCKKCILKIVTKKIKRVVYMDRKYDHGSMQVNRQDIDKVFDIAYKGKVKIDKFGGGLGWLEDWLMKLKSLGIFDPWNI